MENESSNKLKGKSMKFDLSKNDYDWFKFDAPIGKGFDQFCKDELEKMPPSDASYECIGEYRLMINDDDLEHMFDYLLAKDGLSFMEVEKEEMEGKKSKMIGTPNERAENLDKEFDDLGKRQRIC
ncbi:hypothetical protein Tco_1123750 [Tanacetum coccineum]|uniref:Uncharacterized protein n=1 Tax=Tanacetum coccineum TaxID=301880 RepID=A0ABQ5J470_9ASTR